MQVTVQKIWPLDPTKKSGGFKGTDSMNYYCEVGAYHLLSEGTTYEVPARPYTSKAGKQSYIVDKSFHPPNAIVGGGPPDTPQHQPTNDTWSRPAASAVKAPPHPAPASNGYGNKDERMIFITGIVGRAMGSGKFDTQDINLLTQAAAEAYETLRK